MSKPNLFIVGAPKCGTTSLHKYLEQHPAVFMSNPKEVNYFSKEELEAQKLYYQDFKVKDESSYLKLFEKASETQTVIGEASVSYLFYPRVANKIKAFNPDAKIIIILRDPVKRAWSHYLMDKRMGLVKKSFNEIFQSPQKTNALFFQQYFLLGNYYTQVKRYHEVFGSDKIFILFSKDLIENAEDEMQTLFNFLEIPPIKINTSAKHNSFKDANSDIIKQLYSIARLRKFTSQLIPTALKNKLQSKLFNAQPPAMDTEMEKKLRDYYHEEVEGLENLLGINLKEWK